MDNRFKDSKTKENLMRAYAGESQARNRYTFAAEMAREQGLFSVGYIFDFTAEQELAHARRFYQLLREMSGQTIEISAGYPVDRQSTIIDLLKSARHNEFEEANDVYIKFGDIAKEEGFLEIASAFYQIAKIEKLHGGRFEKVAKLLEEGKYFEHDEIFEAKNGAVKLLDSAIPEDGVWMCLNCGHIYSGKKVPKNCPVCKYDKGYFIPVKEFII